MQRYLLVLLVAAFLIASPAYAELRTMECGESLPQAEASQLLDRVQRKYATVKALRAGFTQHSYLAAMDTAELSSGTVWFQKPGRMKWIYREPEEQIFLVRDETLWFYQAVERQVMIHEFKEVLLTDLPVAFLMGIGDLRKDFELRSACRNQDGIVLELKPGKGRKTKDELQGFKLLIDRATNFPKGAEVVHVGGNSTTILLDDIQFEPPLDPKLFEPEFPKGTDINDMRGKAAEQ